MDSHDQDDAGIIIELKYAPTFQSLNTACATALEQIKDRNYAEALQNDGRVNILAYGIAFHKKRCRVRAERLPGGTESPSLHEYYLPEDTSKRHTYV